MKMPPWWFRRSVGFAALIALAACLLLAVGGCAKKAAPAPPKVSNAPTEQRWIIGSVARDLAGMATFAADPDHWTPLPAGAVDVRETPGAEPGQRYTLSVQLPGGSEPVKSDLQITGSVWSPELYVPTLRGLMAQLKLVPPAAASDANAARESEDLLKVLATPQTADLETQNQRISAELQAHPLDASAHEQAALLLGTLAMRENSGLWWNPRGLCNRAAAHLAFARALRPEASPCGEVAELLIGLIIDTKADCQKRIAALRAQTAAYPELGPWVMAAALRNTRDYRLLETPGSATLLERVERFRALSEAISSEQAVARTPDHEPSYAPDWERIVLQGGCSVNTGHQFATPSTGLEIGDAARIFPDLRTARAPAQFASILNVPPGDAVQTGDDQHAHFRVIDRGTWAQFFQRHLLQAANETYNFLQYKYGVPEEAKSFRVQVGPLLKRLTLYPLCLTGLGKEDGDGLFAPAADLLNQHPEWVSDGGWKTVVKTVPVSLARGGSWRTMSREWFSPSLPTGTVYGIDWRVDDGPLPALDLPALKQAYAIAPLKYSVCRLYVNAMAPGHHPTVAQWRQVMGALPAYYLPAIWGEAWLVQGDPAQYGAAMKRAGALNPNYYLALGKYYVDHSMEPEAAAAYQAAIDQNADPVGVANDCAWLVQYYYHHGQQDRAMTIAQQAAEVYSSEGLATMGRLLESMNRIPEAESYYEKIVERYNDTRAINAFYVRQAPTHPEYAEKMKGAEGQLFPRGMEEVTLAQLSGSPTKGLIVVGENDLSRRFGLKQGAIIVGVDGKRVRNFGQYAYVRALKETPEIDLLVYQDGRYQAIHASVPGRMFNLVFNDWP